MQRHHPGDSAGGEVSGCGSGDGVEQTELRDAQCGCGVEGDGSSKGDSQVCTTEGTEKSVHF